MTEPKDVDLKDGLLSTFGCAEFEEAAVQIILFLADETRSAGIPEWLFGNGPATGWGKKLTIDTLVDRGVDDHWFAMLCAAGWLENAWFPKGSFVVSERFVKRLDERAQGLVGRARSREA